MSDYNFVDSVWGPYVRTIPLPRAHGFSLNNDALQVQGIDLSVSLFMYAQASIPQHGSCDIETTAAEVGIAACYHPEKVRLSLARLVIKNKLWLYPKTNPFEKTVYAIGRGDSKGRLTNVSNQSLKSALAKAERASSKGYFTVPAWYAEEGLCKLAGQGLDIAVALAYEANRLSTTEFEITMKRLRILASVGKNVRLLKLLRTTCQHILKFYAVNQDTIHISLLNPVSKRTIAGEWEEWKSLPKKYAPPLTGIERTRYEQFIKSKGIDITNIDNNGEMLNTCICKHKKHGKAVPTLRVNLDLSRWGMCNCYECKYGGDLLIHLADMHGTSQSQLKKEAIEYLKAGSTAAEKEEAYDAISI